MSGFVKCVDVAPGSDTTTFQIQAGINTYTLTSQKWVDWVAELPGRGEGKHGHFWLLIWGFGSFFMCIMAQIISRIIANIMA